MISAPEDEAKAFFEGLLDKFPENPDLLYRYVSYTLRKKTDLDKGAEVAEKMVDLTHRTNPYQMVTYARVLAAKKDTVQLHKEYGKSYAEERIQTLNSDLRNYASFWAQKGENLESAREMIEMAMKMDPENSSLKSIAATVYLKMDLEDEAMSIYGPDYIQEIMEKSSDLYRYASYWARENRNLESALKAAKQAVKLSPQPYIWNVLASVYWKMKEYPKAQEALEEAVTLQPSNNYYRSRLKQLKKEIKEAG
jgi:tetratricopeptide (TPR) repeat protein